MSKPKSLSECQTPLLASLFFFFPLNEWSVWSFWRMKLHSGLISCITFSRERFRGENEVHQRNDKFSKEEISTSKDIINNGK